MARSAEAEMHLYCRKPWQALKMIAKTATLNDVLCPLEFIAALIPDRITKHC
jgi:hypothetical protein